VNIEHEINEDTVVVDVAAAAPSGTGLDAATQLRERLRALAARGYHVILLNLADVAYIDSVLLGAIVQAYAAAIRSGGTLKLLNASNRVRELLRITKLDRLIDTIDRRP
jgi:anti-anti-sigma factor